MTRFSIRMARRRWWTRGPALCSAVALWVATGTVEGFAADGADAVPATDVDVTFGVFFDAAGTECSGTIRPGTPGTVYVVARSAPGTEIISGAEFRFSGVPSSWTVYPVPNPTTLSLGDPFGAGCNIAATSTQCDPEWSTFLMYTVLVIATDDADDVHFSLTNREPPGNPAFRCPLVTDCHGWVKHCVETSPCFVNASAPAPCAQTTAVQKKTWSEVRSLYR